MLTPTPPAPHHHHHDTLCLRHKCLELYCLFCLRPAVVQLSWSPHIRDLRLFAEHMLRGSEQFANCAVINKTNTLCKDTDINHGAAGEQREERKSIFDCLSEFQFGPVKTERVWAQDIRGMQSGAGSAGGWLSAHSSGFMCGSAEIHLPFCLHEAPE